MCVCVQFSVSYPSHTGSYDDVFASYSFCMLCDSLSVTSPSADTHATGHTTTGLHTRDKTDRKPVVHTLHLF